MSCTLSTCLAVLLSLPQGDAPKRPQDPEQTPAGRAEYLGRRVAHTMHWTGAAWLMRKTREDEENGALLRQWLAVQPGQSVCDLGCGNGYHTLPLARAVGPEGTVYAVDLQPQMLTMLRQRSDGMELDNLEFIKATVDDPKLATASCDLVLMVDVYHELSHPVRVMQKVRRALKPEGRVVLVEFRAEDPDVPIKPEHMMTKAQVIREMAAHGFTLLDGTDALPWQHAMAFGIAKTRGPFFAAEQLLQGFLRARAGKDPRIVRPFLARDVAVADLPRLAPGKSVELRSGDAGAVVATLRAHEVVLRADDDGRWQVTDVRARAPSKAGNGR